MGLCAQVVRLRTNLDASARAVIDLHAQPGCAPRGLLQQDSLRSVGSSFAVCIVPFRMHRRHLQLDWSGAPGSLGSRRLPQEGRNNAVDILDNKCVRVICSGHLTQSYIVHPDHHNSGAPDRCVDLQEDQNRHTLQSWT